MPYNAQPMGLKDFLVLLFVLQWARIPKSFNISWSVASLWKSQSTLTLDLLSLNLVRSKFKIPFHGRQLQKLASAQWLGRSTFIIKLFWVNKLYMILKLGKGPSKYYVSTFLDLFWPTHPSCQHKYSTERQQKLSFFKPTHPFLLLT